MWPPVNRPSASSTPTISHHPAFLEILEFPVQVFQSVEHTLRIFWKLAYQAQSCSSFCVTMLLYLYPTVCQFSFDHYVHSIGTRDMNSGAKWFTDWLAEYMWRTVPTKEDNAVGCIARICNKWFWVMSKMLRANIWVFFMVTHFPFPQNQWFPVFLIAT